jgi:hypothetical protein
MIDRDHLAVEGPAALALVLRTLEAESAHAPQTA